MTLGPTCANHKNMPLSSHTKSIFNMTLLKDVLTQFNDTQDKGQSQGKTVTLVNYGWFLTLENITKYVAPDNGPGQASP